MPTKTAPAKAAPAKTAAKTAPAKPKTKLVPLADRIVITPLKQDEVTASGLVIPDTAKEKPQQGEVMAVGNGRLDDNGKRVPMDVAVGDRILYAKYTGTDVKLDGIDYIVLNEKDILAKLVV
jgi:chaperonin GroES